MLYTSESIALNIGHNFYLKRNGLNGLLNKEGLWKKVREIRRLN